MLILVVEDEPLARVAHLSLLSKIREVSVIAASSVAEARAVIAEQTPKVVILDMQLPDGTGLDVVAALEARGSQSVLIVVSAHLETFRPAIHPSERIHLLSKPAPIHELRRIVEQVAQAKESPGPFSVVDYVQLAGMGLHSVTIECTDHGARGEIVMDKGQPFSAQDEKGVGVPAFNRLVMATGIHVRVLSDKKLLGPRNLTDRWEHLVLEAMRIGDETRFNSKSPRAVKSESSLDPAAEAPAEPRATAALTAEPTKPSAAVKEPPARDRAEGPDPLAEQAAFDACTERALRAVVNRDFALAMREFESAQRMRPGDRMVHHRLEKLRKLREQQTR